MDTKQLIKDLPSNWDEVTLKQYELLLDCPIDEGNDLSGYHNTINFVSRITQIPAEQFEELPMSVINQIGEKLEFILYTIPNKKTDKFKWKDVDEITMDEFITFVQWGDKAIYNLPDFIRIFNKKSMSEEEILSLPITEVMYGFFLFRRKLRKYFHYSIASMERMLAISYLKTMAKNLFKKATSPKITKS